MKCETQNVKCEMQVILSKLLRDCWLSKGKLLLMILAASLSSWGISSVVYSYVMAERDFEVNFARTFPADIEIVVDNYQMGLEGILLSDSNVIDVERREVLGGSIKNIRGEWMPLILFGVEDIQNMRLDVFRILEEEAKVPGKVLIETNAKYFLDEERDSIEVQFSNQEVVHLKIGGTSHDARLAPARMERAVFAHATSIDVLEPFLKAGQKRLLVETNNSFDKTALQGVAERLKVLVQQAGSQITFVAIPEPGEHMHQNIVDGISFLQESMGLILAIMGMILLSLILLTWIFPRISDIGVMKAIGASAHRIFYSYVIVLCLIIMLGLIIGMPLGYKTAKFYNGVVAFIQNFEPVVDPLSVHVHLFVILLGLIIPLLIAIMPLLRASKTTVNEAMNKTFYTPNQRFFQFSQYLITGSRLKYCVNNLFRNSRRTLLVICLMAVGMALFFTGSNLEYSVRKELETFAKEAQYRLRVRFSEELKIDSLAFLYDLPFVKSISPMKDKLVTYQPPNAAFTETRPIRILSSKHIIRDDFVIKGKVDKSCQNCLYISGEGMRQEFESLALGQAIELRFGNGEAKSFLFSGIFKDMAAIGSPFFLIDNSELETFNALAFEIKPGFSHSEVNNGVDDALLENGIDMAGMIDVNRRIGQLQGHLEPTYFIIKITGIFTVLLGFLGLLIVLNLTLQERTREIGILKSIGCTFTKTSNLFQLEFLPINFCAILLGLLLALPLTASLCGVLGKTVIYHLIPARSHFLVIVATAILVLALQMISIWIFNWMKIKKGTRSLIGNNF